MPSASQISANRQAAIATVRAALGLSDTPSDWTYDQRTAYNKALATYILSNPDLFTDQDLTNAETATATTYQPLEDDSFDWGDFATDAFQPLSAAAQSVGQGVFTVANAAKWALPLVAVIGGVILLLALNRRANAK